MSAPLHLAVELDGDGAHRHAWRRSTHPPNGLLDPALLRRRVLAAESAGFTLVTFDDALTRTEHDEDATAIQGRLDAVLRSAFVAPQTSRVGLAPTVQPRAVEPFHAAAQLASLDIASLGRAAWVVADDDQPGLAEALDRRVPHETPEREQEIADVVRVVRALWDSWEDDAVIKDVASGRYIDADRVHNVEFEGAAFSVTGALITPRPPQGQVVVIAPSGLLPAELTDVALIDGRAPQDLAAATAQARTQGIDRTFADVIVVLDTPEHAAADRLAGLGGADPSWQDRLVYTGDPAGLVDLLGDLAGDVDGVRLHPAVLDEDLPVLVREVLPVLLRRRQALAPIPGDTLRQSLGLPRPANQFDTRSAA